MSTIKYLAIMLVILSANSAQSAFQSMKENSIDERYNTSLNDSLAVQNPVLMKASKANASAKTQNVWVTAYSSDIEQTDDTPFITASGSYVRNGIAAANFLPFGTQFRLPSIFGSQIFTVEDRMHPRFEKRVDIWFETKEEAKTFGKQWTEIEIIHESSLVLAKSEVN